MAELLEVSHDVHRINTEPAGSVFVENEVTFRWRRVRHYVGMRSMIRRRLEEASTSPVLWASISPSTLGHFRDATTVASVFPSRQPVAGIIHRSGYSDLFRSQLTRPTAVWLARRLHAFVFLNATESERCAHWIPSEKRYVIPNTIDRELVFSNEEIEEKRSERAQRAEMRLLYLSNIIPLKGYRDVVRAAVKLKEDGFPFRLDFVGRFGSDDDRLFVQQVAEKHSLTDHIRLHGGIDDRSDIKEWYRKADVFVLPTYHPTEAQPVSLIEAMSAGVPIVTTRHGGIRNMLFDGEAVFVRRKCAQDIAESVHALSDINAWQRFSLASRRAYERSFSTEFVAGLWETLLNDLTH